MTPTFGARGFARSAAIVIALSCVAAACGAVGNSGVTAKSSRANGASGSPSESSAPVPTAPVTTLPNAAPTNSVPPTTTTTVPTEKPPTVPDTTPASPSGTRPSPLDTTTDTQKPLAVPSNQSVIDFGSTKPPQSYDGYLVAAFSDIEAFWAAQYPAVYGSSFKPLSGGIFAAYPSRREPIPGCGSGQTAYADVKGNAFYCTEGDFIVYDDAVLLPELVKSLGESSVGVVLAHEFGHAIQQRAGDVNQPTILREQQADCFAGAWAAHVGRGEAANLSFGDAQIKQGLIAMIQVRDPLFVSGSTADAHGSGFDRVGAFQDGFVGGTKRCSTFFTEGRENNLIDIPFNPADPTGNLPFQDPTGAGNDIVTDIPADLNRFWTTAAASAGATGFSAPTLTPFPAAGPYPACAGLDAVDLEGHVVYCASSNSVLVDQDLAVTLDADPLYGDLSIGYLIGDAYAEAVQTAAHSTLTGAKRVLLDDCYTGAWTATDIPDPTTGQARGGGKITLSAGDLDEAIATALTRSDSTADQNQQGTAFDKIAAFRAGVLGGVSACRQRYG